MRLCFAIDGSLPEESTVMVMEDDRLYITVEEVTDMEPNPCYSTMQARADCELYQ